MKLKLTWEPVTRLADASRAPEPPGSLTWCYVPMKIVLTLIALGVSGMTFGASGNFEWPPLPREGFVSGRTATIDDVSAGRGVFSLEGSTASNIVIPQYAWHINQENGVRTPVIVLQAESNGNVSIIGFVSALDGSPGAGLSFEFELLGTDPSAGGT